MEKRAGENGPRDAREQSTKSQKALRLGAKIKNAPNLEERSHFGMTRAIS